MIPIFCVFKQIKELKSYFLYYEMCNSWNFNNIIIFIILKHLNIVEKLFSAFNLHLNNCPCIEELALTYIKNKSPFCLNLLILSSLQKMYR